MKEVVIACLLVVVGTIGAIRSMAMKKADQGKPFSELYCTKHTIQRAPFGGPEHLVWVYGNSQNFRTPGNACDGGKHHRTSPYW